MVIFLTRLGLDQLIQRYARDTHTLPNMPTFADLSRSVAAGTCQVQLIHPASTPHLCGQEQLNVQYTEALNTFRERSVHRGAGRVHGGM